ncbi:MAG: hypothetical protein HXY48_11910 [Ignavibacteriaceae bacterium]|nr:hypothetical protein [Ignavibacteriaceae bacterium]
MLKFILILFVYTIQFYIPALAQSTESLVSTKSGTDSGLIFEKETDNRLDDSSYTEIIQLLNLTKKAQAVQFRILINKAADDSTILIFKDLQKGNDLKDPAWQLTYNLKKGPVSNNGASKDEIYVVLYNVNQNSGLLPGDYKNLFTVTYQVPAIPRLKNKIKSSLKISNAEASTFDGFAIDVKPTRDEFKIFIKAK